MRRIVTKEQEDKKRKRNQILIGVVLMLVMFFSTIGYGYSYFISNNEDIGDINDTIQTYDFNGFEFRDLNGFFITNKNGNSLIFRNSPDDVKNIFGIEIDSLDKIEFYKDKELYVYSDDDLAKSEIITNINLFVKDISGACYDGKNCGVGVPIKTCEDNLIVIEESENSRIFKKDNCVFIQGKKEDLILFTDKYLFKLFGIEE